MRMKRFLIFWTVVAVVAAGAYLGFTQFDRVCTELAIRDFRARPSATGARTLAELVDEGSATPAQVERILPLLLTPKVTKQDKYPLGETPTIRVELPFEVAFRSLAVDVNESVWVGGVSQYGTGMTGAQTLRTNPHSLSFHPAPTEAGTCTMEVRYTYKFRPQRRRAWQWNPSQGVILPRRRFIQILAAPPPEPKYEWRMTVPVEIVVVPGMHLVTPSR
jgi:hypothetical protein